MHCCMDYARRHNSAEFVSQVSLLTKLSICIEERKFQEEKASTETFIAIRQEHV